MTHITLPKATPGQSFEIINQGISDITIASQPLELIKSFPDNPLTGQMCIKQDEGVHVFVNEDEGWQLISGIEQEQSLFDAFISQLEDVSPTQLSELYNKMDEFKLAVERKLLENC